MICKVLGEKKPKVLIIMMWIDIMFSYEKIQLLGTNKKGKIKDAT